MKYCIPFILVSILVCFSQTEISGELSGTLEVSGSPYYVVGDITVESGEELTIEPGCELVFLGSFSISVDSNAAINTNGTSEDSVLFTCSDSLSELFTENFNLIEMHYPLSNTIEYCKVEGFGDRLISALLIETTDSFTIKNCNFLNNYNSSYIISYSGRTLVLDSCNFEDNSSCLYINDYESCYIFNTVFWGNGSGTTCIFGEDVLSDSGCVKIDGCTFAFNHSTGRGGCILYETTLPIEITNSIFAGNQAHRSCILYCEEELEFSMVNCTFYNNEDLEITLFGAQIFSHRHNNCSFLNSVFLDDFDTTFFPFNFLGGGEIFVNNCNIDTTAPIFSRDDYIIANNIFYEDPMFIDCDLSDSTFNFALQEGSPCIDRGAYFADRGDGFCYASDHDIEGFSRPSGITYDVGAYERDSGPYVNIPPVIDCPGDTFIFCGSSFYERIYVTDLFIDSLELEYTSDSIFDISSNLYEDQFYIELSYDHSDPCYEDQYYTFSVTDGELADTCSFWVNFVPEVIDSDLIEYDTIYVEYRDYYEYVIEGISPYTTTRVIQSGCDPYFVDHVLYTSGIHYEQVLTFYGSHVRSRDYWFEYYDNERFRRVNLHVIVEDNSNSPEFYGCPDTLVLMVPSEATFIYMEVEDPYNTALDIELVDYPEPYEDFWNFRYDIDRFTADLYFQFYPSFDDTGLYYFRVEASNPAVEDCRFFVYVTKDTSQLCPYVEPETLYFEYLEGMPIEEEITIYDNFNIHNWHIETDCDSILCVFPNQGYGSYTSTVIPECRLNGIDILFAVDITGSMGPEIDSLVSNLNHLVELAHESRINVRYGLVTFRDDYFLYDFNEFTPGFNMTNSNELLSVELSALVATGGGDGPEVSLDAIAESVLEYDWNPDALHHVIMITNAPYHYRGDGTSYSSYLTEEVESILLDNDVILSIHETSYDPVPWYESVTDLTGGEHYTSSFDYIRAFDYILELLESYAGMDHFLSEGTYECNLTYVMDYPVTCRSIDVPVVINILDSSDTYNTYNCPEDTIRIVPGVCDTLCVDIEYTCCDSPYVNLVEYPIDHVDMWRYASRIGYNSTKAMLIFTPEASDSGLYYYRIEYGNEYGSDTCSFFVRVLGQEPFYHFYEGWNLLSYPFTEPNTELITLNPDMVRPYTWNASEYSYELPDEITTADAFWLYSNIEMYYDIHYTTISEITTTLYAGWNMVSSVGDTLEIDILTSHPEVVTPVYYYNTNAGEYEAATEILPGIGYWLMSTETFEISYP